MNAVKRNLKRLRISKGLTQDDLAEKLHVVRQTISSWETGKTTPDLETLATIAEVLSVDIKELIYGPMPVDTFSSKRTKRIQRAVCWGIAAIILGVLGLLWTEILTVVGFPDTFYADFNQRSFRHLLHALGGGLYPTVVYTLAGVVAVLMIESWRDFSWLTIGIRRGAFWVGLMLSVSYLVIGILTVTSFWHVRVLFQIFYFIYPRQYIFFVSGLMIGSRVAFVAEGGK